MDQEAAPGPRSAAAAAASGTRLFAAQQAALTELMSGMDADARWVLLLGEQGSGKTTVIRALLEELRLSAASVAVFEGPARAPDVKHLVNGLRDHLGLPYKRKLGGADRSIADILASQSGRRTPLVVVVDDANALPKAGVIWLARLAARAARTGNVCYVVLAGTPALQKAASRAWPSGRSGNTSVRSVLKPMTSAEIHRYVALRSHSDGDPPVKFSAAAIQKLEMYSKGWPGPLADLCTRAMRLPTTRITNEVSGDAVEEAAARLAPGEAPADAASRTTRILGGSRLYRARRVGVVLVAAVVAVLFLYLGIRVGLRLFETTAWLWPEPPRDRSRSDVVRAANDEPRREGRARVELSPGRTVPTAPTRTASVGASTPQRGEPRLAERAAQRPPERSERRSPEGPERAASTASSAPQIAALMARAREGEVGELTRLIGDGLSPNARDVGGFTPLMAAVVNDQLPAARLLLDRGADVNARAHGDITALMLAVINDRQEAVKLLLARGAEVNAQSGAGWTALTFAVWKSDAALERVLLSHGAKPNVFDKQGWRPLEYAPPKITSVADPGSHVDSERAGSVPSNSPQTR